MAAVSSGLSFYCYPWHVNELHQPLSQRLRPSCLEEVAGQRHLLAPGKPLWAFFNGKLLFSFVLYGPPGVGKTTVASLLLKHSPLPHERFSAVMASITEVKEVIKQAKKRHAETGQPTLLFVDEFHRFNRQQQDAFLPWVEEGVIVLMGLTTENPYFCLQRALLSRVRLFKFKPLAPEDLAALVDRALESSQMTLDEKLKSSLVGGCGGDARQLLDTVDLLVQSTQAQGVTHLLPEHLKELELDLKPHTHDRAGDSHYDIISALIKSIRGSDVDASLFWMARLLAGGEDLMFILRRMLILASEDIGNADPQALVLAASARLAIEHVGPPEAHLILSQLVCYLALAPKSNAAYKALKRVEKHVSELEGPTVVPVHLRGKSTRQGEADPAAYRYPHDESTHWVAQAYFPVGVTPRKYYEPSQQGQEANILTWLKNAKKS